VRHPVEAALERPPKDPPAPDEDTERALDGDAQLGEVEVVAVRPRTNGARDTRDWSEKIVGERVRRVADDKVAIGKELAK
jgi:hypothetical protein